MTRFTIRQLGVTVLALSALATTQGCDGSKPEVVHIGVLMPMTGSGQDWGQNGHRGVELAAAEINAAGGIHGRSVVIDFEDTRSVPTDAVSAFRRLLDQKGIHVMVVDMISSDVLAIAPIAERDSVVIMSPGASNPAITTAGDFVFRNWPSDALQGALDAQYAYEVLGWRKAAILAIQNDYGDALTQVFRDRFTALGGAVVFADAFPQGASSFRAMITKVRGSQFDGIFIPGYPKEIPILIRQLREQGVKSPLLGTESFEDPAVMASAGPTMEGAVFSIPASPDSTLSAVAKFRTGYRAKFNQDPGVPADVAYDALHILADAISRVSDTLSGAALATAVHTQLYGVQQYPGASGLTGFDKNGDAVKPFEFRVIRGGKSARADRQLAPAVSTPAGGKL